MTYSPERIRQRCKQLVAELDTVTLDVSARKRGAIIGKLNAALALPDGSIDETVNMNRKLVLAWLFLDSSQVFLPMSSKLMTLPQWIALGRWQSYFKPGAGYLERPTFKEEARWILNRAKVDYEQTMHGAAQGNPPLFEQLLMRWHDDGIVTEIEALGGVVTRVEDDFA